MAQIQSLYIDSFRGIKDLYLEHLSPINMIVGNNNSGKTSVLEAVQLMRTYDSGLASLYIIARDRGYRYAMEYSDSIYENVMCMFPKNNQIKKIEISGECDGTSFSFRLTGKESKGLIELKNSGAVRYKRSDVVETESFEGGFLRDFGRFHKQEAISLNRYSLLSEVPYSERDGFPIVYVGSFAHLRGNVVGEIVRNDDYKEICINMLKLFDSDIEDILTLPSDIGNHTVEYLKHRKLGNMPLSTYGDGIKRALVLANDLAKARNGILLIDEIETSIHRQFYDDIFRFIIKACLNYNIQLFLTTHSMETVDAILNTQNYEEKGNDKQEILKVITLHKEGEKTLSRIMNGYNVQKNREEFGFEVRL